MRGGAAVLLGLALAVPGCGAGAGKEPDLRGSATSLEALAGEVMTGLAAADTARLESVRLDEREHNELVWPELPAADPEANFPVDLAWRNIRLRNARARERLLARYAGKRLELEGVECVGPTVEFESFRVRTDCSVTFRSGDGEPIRRQLFKDVLVRDERHKIFRYYEP